MLISLIQDMARKASYEWVLSTSKGLRNVPKNGDAEKTLQLLPVMNNADIAFLMREMMHAAENTLSWESLGWCLETAAKSYHRWNIEQQVELLLTGPLPMTGVSIRRVDQVLYDLIQSAKSEIMLVTFAASKIQYLVKVLCEAQQRGVRIKLILEFAQSSKGQLTFDALKAFPPQLIGTAEIYCWPIEKRERNQAGKPGKLHAKVALIDDTVLISSANLTDDAFNRNLEMGVNLRGGNLPNIIFEYFDGLVAAGVLDRVK